MPAFPDLPSITTLLTFAGGLVSGAIVALKIIAPRTKTKKDDRVLEALEKLPKLPPSFLATEAPTSSAPAPRDRTRDHR